MRSPKRGWAQFQNGGWYTANITNDLSNTGAFSVKFDDKDELTGVPRDRVLRDGDRVFVSWDDVVLCLGFRSGSKAAAVENGCAGQVSELDDSAVCFEATLVLKDHGRDKDVIHLTDPDPAWPPEDAMDEGENPVLNLNDSNSAAWAHTKDGLVAKLVAAAQSNKSSKRKSKSTGGRAKKKKKPAKKKKKK